MREFALIFAAAIVSAIAGGAFGWAIGNFSPEFIQILSQPHPVHRRNRSEPLSARFPD